MRTLPVVGGVAGCGGVGQQRAGRRVELRETPVVGAERLPT
ncbi:hypothetical protein [Candidatus Accumulibacter contiguus]